MYFSGRGCGMYMLQQGRIVSQTKAYQVQSNGPNICMAFPNQVKQRLLPNLAMKTHSNTPPKNTQFISVRAKMSSSLPDTETCHYPLIWAAPSQAEYKYVRCRRNLFLMLLPIQFEECCEGPSRRKRTPGAESSVKTGYLAGYLNPQQVAFILVG